MCRFAGYRALSGHSRPFMLCSMMLGLALCKVRSAWPAGSRLISAPGRAQELRGGKSEKKTCSFLNFLVLRQGCLTLAAAAFSVQLSQHLGLDSFTALVPSTHTSAVVQRPALQVSDKSVASSSYLLNSIIPTSSLCSLSPRVASCFLQLLPF